MKNQLWYTFLVTSVVARATTDKKVGRKAWGKLGNERYRIRQRQAGMTGEIELPRRTPEPA